MRSSPNQRGFSLIEFVLVIIIISIISVVVSRFLITAFNTFITANQISSIEYQALLAMNHLSNDIQNIRSANDISTINSNALTFTDVYGNSIAYSVSGTNLLRSGVTLIDNLSSITFGYLDANGNTTSTATSVVYITFSLTLIQGTLTETFSNTISSRFNQ